MRVEFDRRRSDRPRNGSVSGRRSPDTDAPNYFCVVTQGSCRRVRQIISCPFATAIVSAAAAMPSYGQNDCWKHRTASSQARLWFRDWRSRQRHFTIGGPATPRRRRAGIPHTAHGKFRNICHALNDHAVCRVSCSRPFSRWCPTPGDRSGSAQTSSSSLRMILATVTYDATIPSAAASPRRASTGWPRRECGLRTPTRARLCAPPPVTPFSRGAITGGHDCSPGSSGPSESL